MAIDLPEWLIPVARAAGLRFEGLTFSYLVLRRGGPTLADALSARPGSGRLRVVSGVMRTKGKSEVFLCGGFSGGCADGHLVVARKCVSRLLRHEGAQSEGSARRWTDLERGDLVVVDPAPSLETARLAPTDRIEFS
jgi:hypothetical protein